MNNTLETKALWRKKNQTASGGRRSHFFHHKSCVRSHWRAQNCDLHSWLSNASACWWVKGWHRLAWHHTKHGLVNHNPLSNATAEKPKKHGCYSLLPKRLWSVQQMKLIRHGSSYLTGDLNGLSSAGALCSSSHTGLLTNVFLCCAGPPKWLSQAPFLCWQAELCTPRRGLCLGLWPQCSRRTLTPAFRAHSDPVGLVKRCIEVILYLFQRMMQGRLGT